MQHIKVRTLAACVIVTLPRKILAESAIKEGDTVIITNDGPDRIIVERIKN